MSHPEQGNPKIPFGKGDSTSSIQFKGRPGAFELRLDPDASLQAILADLEKSLQSNQQLAQQLPVRLHFGQREFDSLQFSEISRTLDKYNFTLEKLEVHLEALQEYLEGEFGLPMKIHTSKTDESEKKVELRKPEPQVSEPIAPKPAPVAPQPPPVQHVQPAPVAPKPPVRTPIPPAQPHVPPPHFAAPAAPNPLGQLSAGKASPPPPKPPRAKGMGHKIPRSDYPGSLPMPELETQPELLKEIARLRESQAPEAKFDRNQQLHKVMYTCRAGTSIEVEGHLVIFGDVNPGATIKATGDIIIFGALRGVAHAGCGGNDNAMIIAFDLRPTQIRLNKKVARSPEEEQQSKRTVKIDAEVAFLNENRAIEVTSYTGKMPIYLQKLANSSKIQERKKRSASPEQGTLPPMDHLPSFLH